MSKHTPGPWELITNLSASENHRGFKIIGADGWRFAEVFPVDEDGIEGKANAHLIAAAPDLLEALEELLCQTRQYGHKPEIKMAEAAIAKAKGESNE